MSMPFVLLLMALLAAGLTAARPALAAVVAPTIVIQPSSQTFVEGQGAVFHVQAIDAVYYRWEITFDGSTFHSFISNDVPNVASGTWSDTMTMLPANGAVYAGKQFRVAVYGHDGTKTTSNVVTLGVAGPALTGITPDTGSANGGTSVTLTGTGLANVQDVTFGGVSANITSASATQITAITPAHAAGAVDVKVITSSDTATLTGGFTYEAALQITAQPSSKTVETGQTATFTVAADGATSYQWQSLMGGMLWMPLSDTAYITGSTTSTLSIIGPIQYMSGQQYRVVAYGAGGTSVTSNAATLTVTAPANPIVISGPNNNFPIITAIVGMPYTGQFTAMGGNGPLTFSAANLPSGLTMATDGTLSGTPIAPSPAHYFTVTASDGNGGSKETGFTINVLPPMATVTAMTPDSGPAGTEVTVNGLNLSGATVLVDGTAVTPTQAGPDSITFIMPDHAPGQVFVTVTVGVINAGIRPFTYTAPAAQLALTPAENTVFPVASGSAFSHSFTASGGTAPYTFSIDSSADQLPPASRSTPQAARFPARHGEPPNSSSRSG